MGPGWRARVSFAVALAVAATPVSGTALAAPKTAAGPRDKATRARVAIAPIEIAGDMAPAWRETFVQRVRSGLERTGADIVSAAEPGDAQFVVTITVRAAADTTYRLRLVAADPSDRSRTTTVEDLCEVCGRGEVAERLEAQAAVLGAKISALASATAIVSVQTDPARAQLSLDGEALGTAPVTTPVAPGEHELQATKPGYRPTIQTFTAVVGAREQLLMRLQPEVGRGRTARLAAGGTLVGVGTASVIAGAVLVGLDSGSFDGRCSGNDRDVNGNCRFLYDTQTGGAVALGLGVAAVIGGAVLIGLTRHRQRRSRAAIRSRARSSRRSP